MMTVGGISSITNGQGAFQGSKISAEKGKFEELVRSVYGESSLIGKSVSSSQVLPELLILPPTKILTLSEPPQIRQIQT